MHMFVTPKSPKWLPCYGCTRCCPKRGCELSNLTFLILVCFVVFILSLGGCVESQALQQTKPFAEMELDACLVITIDMSGSFSQSWEGRAYPLFIELMDQFFTNGSEESRIVICQLSGQEKVVLFEGRPADLRLEFSSPEELSKFLQKHSDPSSSQVFRAVDQAIAYVLSMPDVTDKTRLMSVILSDLADSETDATVRRNVGHKMLATLKRYRELGGGLAFYFVAQDEMARWKKILDMAGFESGMYVIESTLVSRPQLPSFD